MIMYLFCFYLILARICKIRSQKVQIHSIVHCVAAFLWTSFILFIYLNNNILNTNFVGALQNLNENQKYMILLAAYHSAGYFLADTIDILLDHTNKKRQIYILHHVVAFAGISTVYWGSYLSIYPIWCLEIGGIVHHLKHAAEVNDFGLVPYYMSHIIYHVIYLFSRILLSLNVFTVISSIHKSDVMLPDIMGLTIAVILLIQNGIWWFHNVKKSLKYGGFIMLRNP